MLEELRITSLGVIEGSVLELGPGLTVVTGETGAGKTMVVTALGLLLGGRGDSGAVRSGARQTRVEGVLRAAPELAAAVEELGGEPEDDRVVLARTVSAEGRSRAFVGGAGVPVSALARVADPLVAVHGQSDQHRLLQTGAQRDALDRFGGPELVAVREEYAARFAELGEVERALAEVLGSARERAREADLLRFGLGEVEAAAPRPGEDRELAGEEERLGFADTLRTAAEQARQALSADVSAGDSASTDAVSATAAARAALDAVRTHDPQAAELADRLRELGYLLADAAADVASYAAGLESDPARLAAVSERRAVLTALTRKYGDTVDEVLAWAEEGQRRLQELDGTEDRAEELRATRLALRETLAGLAGQLSRARTEAAGRLAAQVTDELRLLAMPHARFEVSVTQRDQPDGGLPVDGRSLRFTASGVDEVELLLAANPGAEPRGLAKGASGGELSRVMLALEVSLADTSPVPTLVFDEVDAGVGGRAAIEVGRRLARLARAAQVVVVTHLPQVAAYADQHVVVSRADDGSVTTSGLAVLDDQGRLQELSRMLAGLDGSDTALAHAQELLETARSGR